MRRTTLLCLFVYTFSAIRISQTSIRSSVFPHIFALCFSRVSSLCSNDIDVFLLIDSTFQLHEEMDQKLSELVEDLTTSGASELNSEKMKELKKICRSSDEYISHVYHLLMTQLNQDHAEIRLSAFQIVGDLFMRSHQFRTLLISNFQEFLELTVETDYEQPLPPPKEVAQKLKKLAIKSVQEWYEKYGEAYKKLSLGYHFLKQNKKVDFQDVTARTLAERKREEEKQRRLENIYKEKAKQAEEEMKEMSEEIQANLTEMENCFKLLMPDPFEFSVNDVEVKSTLGRTGDEAKTSSLHVEKETNVQASLHSTFDDERPCCSKDLPPVPLNQETGESGISRDSGCREEAGKGPLPMECEADEANEDDSFIRKHGLGSHMYSLNLEISTDLKVYENEDNSAVVTNLLDIHRLIRNKFWPSVQSWIQLFTKAGINDDRLRYAIDLKRQLEIALKKHERLNIECRQRERKVMKATDDEDEDEDDFVEVPEKEGYEPHIPDHLRKEYGLEPPAPPQAKKLGAVKLHPHLRPKINYEELDPTCAAATWKLIKDKLPKLPPSHGSMPGSQEQDASGECSNKPNQTEEERVRAPVMPFGIDLYYWGQDQPTAGRILKFSSQHRFWAPNELEEEVENEEMAAMLKTRYITFPGKFEPVKHKCRAPMPDGRLCERQDRFKCPFHGKIIPRDELGNPTNPEDKAREAKKRLAKQAEEQDWRDPEFMKEIEAATGVDLGSSTIAGRGRGGKRKGKKKKYPNLTDLKQHTNTSRSRLQKKVFNKAAMQRVVDAMNRMDKRKHEKFANQFNYALN